MITCQVLLARKGQCRGGNSFRQRLMLRHRACHLNVTSICRLAGFGTEQEVRRVDRIGFLCILVFVKVIEHLFRRVHMNIQGSAQQAICDRLLLAEQTICQEFLVLIHVRDCCFLLEI
jgi:hypothetical protein